MDAVELDDVQLPHLATFSKAAELSSFTGAAKALGLTQAAVSQRIQVLEKTLRKILFQRRGGRVLLTEGGRRLPTHPPRRLYVPRAARPAVTRTDASGGPFHLCCSCPAAPYRLSPLPSAP